MIYVNMALGCSHGWGICGKYIARELAKLEPVTLVSEPFDVGIVGDVLEFHELQGLLLPEDEASGVARPNGVCTLRGPLLQGIGDERLMPRRVHIAAGVTIGYTFFENNLLGEESIANGRRFFKRIVTGSSWCTRILTESGLCGIRTVIQGVDRNVFHPRADTKERREFLSDKFVVFSGGKFEFRKGQDLVIRAYKVLQDRHADVMLVNAWHNPWPALFDTMHNSRLIRFRRHLGLSTEAIKGILIDNGIDLRRVVTCPQQANVAMARLYWNTDVAIFPNRCEGGTNLVLMEYMACGMPVIAVRSTGQGDIVNRSNAVLLGTKGETTVHNDDGVPVARWPEPDLDDAIDKLEWAYQNRQRLRQFGYRAAEDLAHRTWRRTAEEFQGIIHEAADQN